jgi:P-type E1-E2 ATPase
VLDESALTGEALPVRRNSGKGVPSGAVNAAMPFDMIATTAAADSTFAGIVRLAEAAHRSKAPSARLADRYALLFVPLSLAVAAGAWAAAGAPIRALAVLVVATPCPLILAVPVAIVAGMSRCAKRGVLVKGGGVLEKLAQAKTLFFDKTGTLTGGRARLVAIETGAEFEAAELLRIAASLDQVSQHVIAQAIVSAARERGLTLSMSSDVEEQPGAGLSGVVDGRRVALGSYAFVSASATPADWSQRFLARMGYEGASGVFVAIDGATAGALRLVDEIREETPRARARRSPPPSRGQALAQLGNLRLADPRQPHRLHQIVHPAGRHAADPIAARSRTDCRQPSTGATAPRRLDPHSRISTSLTDVTEISRKMLANYRVAEHARIAAERLLLRI